MISVCNCFFLQYHDNIHGGKFTKIDHILITILKRCMNTMPEFKIVDLDGKTRINQIDQAPPTKSLRAI